jgi:cell division protein FtsX
VLQKGGTVEVLLVYNKYAVADEEDRSPFEGVKILACGDNQALVEYCEKTSEKYPELVFMLDKADLMLNTTKEEVPSWIDAIGFTIALVLFAAFFILIGNGIYQLWQG